VSPSPLPFFCLLSPSPSPFNQPPSSRLLLGRVSLHSLVPRWLPRALAPAPSHPSNPAARPRVAVTSPERCTTRPASICASNLDEIPPSRRACYPQRSPRRAPSRIPTRLRCSARLLSPARTTGGTGFPFARPARAALSFVP
jgi:hypothetical protein